LLKLNKQLTHILIKLIEILVVEQVVEALVEMLVVEQLVEQLHDDSLVDIRQIGLTLIIQQIV
jgi:hypothetical protein